jgi:UPF0271 protein
MDLNSDVGESFGRYELGRDRELLPLVTSANIACGFHAGDPCVMDETVRMARIAGVTVGAHPGYPDLQGFGRRVLEMTPEEVEAMVLYQIGALAGFAKAHGVELVHVKPHGALYNQAAKDRPLADAIARAVSRMSRGLVLVGLAGSLLLDAGREAGLRVAAEGFPERGYNPDGSLMSRKLPGAVIHDPQQAAQNALRLATEGIRIQTPEGERILPVDTLCIHGDSLNAVAVAQAVNQALLAAGVKLSPLA